MAKSKFISTADIRLGAIARFAHKRGLGREAVRDLLMTKAGFELPAAEQLSQIWFGNYRHNEMRNAALANGSSAS